MRNNTSHYNLSKINLIYLPILLDIWLYCATLVPKLNLKGITEFLQLQLLVFFLFEGVCWFKPVPKNTTYWQTKSFAAAELSDNNQNIMIYLEKLNKCFLLYNRSKESFHVSHYHRCALLCNTSKTFWCLERTKNPNRITSNSLAESDLIMMCCTLEQVLRAN